MKNHPDRQESRPVARMGPIEYSIIAVMIVVAVVGVVMYFGGLAWLFD